MKEVDCEMIRAACICRSAGLGYSLERLELMRDRWSCLISCRLNSSSMSRDVEGSFVLISPQFHSRALD